MVARTKKRADKLYKIKMSLWSHSKRVCHYCKTDLVWIKQYKYGEDNIYPDNLYTLDHVIPYSKGGSDHKDNIVMCCEKCNLSKDTDSASSFELIRLLAESMLIDK